MFVLIAQNNSQIIKELSKEVLLEKIITNNTQLKIQDAEIKMAESDYLQTDAFRLPNVGISYTPMITNSPLMAFGSKLNQERISMIDFDPARLNSPDAIGNFSTVLEVKQPIYNAETSHARKAAKLKMESYAYQADRAKEHLSFEALKVYYQLQLAYQASTVLDNAKKVIQSNLTLVENYFQSGLLQKNEVLDVKVRLSDIDNQWNAMQLNIKNASDFLSYLMNDNVGQIIYKPLDELNVMATVSENVSLTEVNIPESRKDLLALGKASEAYQQMYEYAKKSNLPKLNAFGNYQINDNNPFGFGGHGYMVGAMFSWNIFDGHVNQSKKQKAKTEYEKAELTRANYLSQSKLELVNAQRQQQDVWNKIQSIQLAVEQSKESFRIVKNRFEQGLLKTTDLLNAEAQTQKKELELYQLWYEYKISMLHIEYLSKQ